MIKAFLSLPGLVQGLLLVVLVVCLRALISVSAGLDLHFDEAHYWEWSRQLDWSYYSKGPLVAWLIRLSTELFGIGEWQVRLFGWLISGLFLIVMYRFACDVWQSREVGIWAVVISLSIPLFFSLGGVMTTDNFLFFFWAWALWAAYRAVSLGQRLAWYEFAIAVGVGGLAKFSIALLPAFGGLFLLLSPSWRHVLASRTPWLAMALIPVIMLPVWYWNWAHDWVQFRHEAGHVAVTKASQFYLLEFLGGQLLALSPVIAVFLLGVMFRWPRERNHQLIWLVSVAVLLFFCIKSIDSKVQLNWAAPTYIGLVILLSGKVPTFSPRIKKWFKAGVVVGFVLSYLLLFAESLGFDGRKDPLRKMKHWEEVVPQLAKHLPEGAFLLSDSYRLAGEMAFYWPDEQRVYLITDGHRRYNQYDIWGGLENQVSRNALFVSVRAVLPETMAQAFEHCNGKSKLIVQGTSGGQLREIYSWLCHNYNGYQWQPPSRY